MRKTVQMKISFKTPRSAVAPKEATGWQINKILREADRTAAVTTVRQIKRGILNEEWNMAAIAATFFQRVCARTPLDEKYMTEKVNMNTGESSWREHIPDDDRCRYDWFITDGKQELFAGDIADRIPSVFDSYNDKAAICATADMIKKTFDLTSDRVRLTIGNNNGHFSLLEYGNDEWDKDTAHPAEGELYEHGVRNRRSVQAPAGMYRITRMELSKIISEVRKSNGSFSDAAYRMRNDGTEKVLSAQQLDSLMRSFRASRTLRLSDLKRYVRLYD